MKATRAWARKAGVDVTLLGVSVLLLLALMPPGDSREPFSSRSLGTFGLLLGLALTRLFVDWDRRHTIAFASGFGLASLGDVLQVHFGVHSYAHADLCGIPLPMFPIWGLVFLVMRDAYGLIDAHTQPYWSRWRFDREATIQLVLFFSATLSLWLLLDRPWVVAAVCFASALALATRDRREGDGRLCALVISLALLAELTAVHGGLYAFRTGPPLWPSEAPIPVWHPLYWLVCVLFFRRTRGRVEKL